MSREPIDIIVACRGCWRWWYGRDEARCTCAPLFVGDDRYEDWLVGIDPARVELYGIDQEAATAAGATIVVDPEAWAEPVPVPLRPAWWKTVLYLVCAPRARVGDRWDRVVRWLEQHP